MPAGTGSSHEHPARGALRSIAAAAVQSIPGVDFASITVREANYALYTAAATDPVAVLADDFQYELCEGPCYEAMTTSDRFVLARDLAAGGVFPLYAPKAVGLGIGAQAAIQLVDGRLRVGLNLYACTADGLDGSTVRVVEFARRAGSFLVRRVGRSPAVGTHPVRPPRGH